MKAEEEDQIAEEARLKTKEHKCARLKVEEEEEEVLLALEVRRQAEEEDEHLRPKAQEEA